MEKLGFAKALGFLAGILLLGGGGYAWFRIRKQVRMFSMALFGTPSLKEGLEHQADILAETPKSVSGMTRLCLPQIQADFPEFHWLQWKQRCENMLRGYLEALESQDISRLERTGRGMQGAYEEQGKDRSGPGQRGAESGISEELRRQTEFCIREQISRGVRERFGQVRIHQTEIARYQKEAGLCIIKLQSAVEYYYQEIKADSESQPKGQGPQKQQTRYNMELVYIQDAAKAGDYGAAAGLTCPNCGAPITNLGSKFCEYCGTGVIPIDIRVWKLHRIEKE